MNMRPAFWIGGIMLPLALASAASAQTTPYQAPIKVPQAEVRSGHGSDPNLYATNLLRYGATVEVTKDLGDGWLEIMPPARSFSWINARMVEQHSGSTYTVQGDRVPVLYGSALRESKPNIEAVHVSKGSQVIRIGRKQTADDGVWLPIEPPPSERRYILAEAVAAPGAPAKAPVKVEADTPLPPSAKWDGTGQRTSKSASPPDLPKSELPEAAGDDLRTTIAEAQKYEKAGDFGSASKLWDKAGIMQEKTNPDAAHNCRFHAQMLQDKISRISSPASPNARQTERLVPTPTYGYPPSYCAPTTVPCGAGSSRPYSTSAPPTQPPEAVSVRKVGTLKRAYWEIDNRATYRLEMSDGKTPLYVQPLAGVNLDSFVDRNVEVEGPIEYRPQSRANCLMAKTVKPLQ
jgi:hypothetical protein